MKFIAIEHDEQDNAPWDNGPKWCDVIHFTSESTAEYWLRGVPQFRAKKIAEALNKLYGYA